MTTNKTSRTPRQRAAVAKRMLERHGRFLSQIPDFTEGDFEMLLRIEECPDGVGMAGGGSSRVGGRSSDRTSATERAAMAPRNIDPRDQTAEAVRTALSGLYEASRLLAVAHLRLTKPVVSDEDVRRKVTIAECQACGELVPNTPNDRLRGGFCNACDVDFRRVRERGELEHPTMTPRQVYALYRIHLSKADEQIA